MSPGVLAPEGPLQIFFPIMSIMGEKNSKRQLYHDFTQYAYYITDSTIQYAYYSTAF
jgi:hypothetical protein